jgi:membrane-associated phospholipid phosphatase
MLQSIQQNKSLRSILYLSLSSGGLLFSLAAIIGNADLFLWINQEWTPAFGQISRLFSLVGESWAMGALLLFSLGIRFRDTLFIAFCWLSGALHSWIFKLWLCKGWPRPLQFFEERQTAIRLVDGVKVHHWNSFPSGHTITAFSLLLLLPILFPQISRLQLLTAWLLAILCGLSRVVLAQHWPMDVAGGIVLGCSATLLTFLLLQNRISGFPILESSLPTLLRRKKEPRPQ